MSHSSGYGSNGSSSNSSNSSNGANAPDANHANYSSTLNAAGSQLAGTSSSPLATSVSSHATCTTIGGGSVSSSNDNGSAQTMAVAMEVDAETDSGMASSLTRTPMNSSTSSLSGDTIAASGSRASVGKHGSMADVHEHHLHVAPLTESNLALYNSVLQDIRSGQLAAQLPSAAARDGREQMAEELRATAAQLRPLQHQNPGATAARGSAQAATAGEAMRGIVDSYLRLIEWLQPGQSLDKAFLDIDYRMQNGSVCRITCKAADTVKDLQAVISARFGASTVGPRQLMCNGEPMTDQTQCLYRFVARRGQGMRRSNPLRVQEVVRASSG